MATVRPGPMIRRLWAAAEVERQGQLLTWAPLQVSLPRRTLHSASRSVRAQAKASGNARLPQDRYEVGAATQLDLLQAQRDAQSADVAGFRPTPTSPMQERSFGSYLSSNRCTRRSCLHSWGLWSNRNLRQRPPLR
jgi:hypothetical protein